MLKPLFAAEPSPRPVSIPFIGEGEDWGEAEMVEFLGRSSKTTTFI